MKFLAPLLMLAIAIFLAGCGVKPTRIVATPTTQPTTSEHARNEQKIVADMKEKRDDAVIQLNAATPENLEVQKPLVLQDLNTMDFDGFSAEAVALGQSITVDTKREATKDKTIEKQGQEIQELKAKDPARTAIIATGYSSLALGLAALLASIFVVYLHAFPWVRSVGVGLMVFGGCMLTIGYYLSEIRLVILCIMGAFVLGGIVWALTHWKLVKDKIPAALALAGTPPKAFGGIAVGPAVTVMAGMAAAQNPCPPPTT